MRAKTGLIVLFLVLIAVAFTAIFFVMSREELQKRAAPKDESLIHGATQHAPKPSPAVPLDKNELASVPNAPAPVGSNSATGAPQSQLWPPDGMQFAAHHKGHKGCDGVLTLKASGLQFTCPGDDGKSFYISRNDIRGPHEDGIITRSGEKYHFDRLPGGGKNYAEQLFVNWLFRVHVVQTPTQ
jgi:hypothetical protein